MEVVKVTLMKRRLPLLLMVTRFSSGRSSRHGGRWRVEVVVGYDGVDPDAAPVTNSGSTELVVDKLRVFESDLALPMLDYPVHLRFLLRNLPGTRHRFHALVGRSRRRGPGSGIDKSAFAIANLSEVHRLQIHCARTLVAFIA